MTFTRLSESAQTLYAELLDQSRVSDAETAVNAGPGSYVSKEIGGKVYWYLQRSEGSRKRQIYVGRDTPTLRERIQAANEQRLNTAADERRRRELVSMLAAAGTFRESAAITTVLQILADAGVFRAGGVLVGTQAFSCTANLLGVRFDQQSLRTADVDVAHDNTIPLGLAPGDTSGVDVLARLRIAEPRFFAVPGLDVREPSTSFKVRGRDLRVDFLTPARSRQSTAPVLLPHLGVAAQPLAGLDYLLEEAIDAVVVAGTGVHVQVPSPARFALHKLWVASQRPASEQAKARKDVRQAEQLLDVLRADRPDDIAAAFDSLERRPSMLRIIRRAWKALP